MNEKVTYIFGHKNPDTDSVCAAISLSYLKNELGYNTIPCILGNVNSETKYALDYFKVKVPFHLNDVKLQIKDVDYHKGNFIDKKSTIKYAFDYITKYSLTGIPVVEKKNKYFGYISLKEIASEVISGDFHTLETSYGNIISILRGTKVLKYDNEIKGTILAATHVNERFINNLKINDNFILIVEDIEKIIDYAVKSKIKMIILIDGASIKNETLSKARRNKINIIKTNLNSYEVGKLIPLSNYIMNFVRPREEITTFNEFDYLSDFYEKSKRLRHTNYPIINGKGQCTGVLTLTDTNHVNRKQVILVDHNNFTQSVDGLEEADIVEIIDHHNLGDIVTRKPINFRSSICGCVSTIIYEMFKENQVKIPKYIAGLLASAIISDTLLLTSPATTKRDEDALHDLVNLAGIDMHKYGMDMLKKGMSVSSIKIEKLFYKDFKSYKTNNILFGIGQIHITDIKSIRKRTKEIVAFLNQEASKEGYSLLTFFATDVFAKKSYCFYNSGSDDIIKNSFNLNKVSEGIELDGILSRKAQIAPYIMEKLNR